MARRPNQLCTSGRSGRYRAIASIGSSVDRVAVGIERIDGSVGRNTKQSGGQRVTICISQVGRTSGEALEVNGLTSNWISDGGKRQTTTKGFGPGSTTKSNGSVAKRFVPAPTFAR